MPGYAANDDFSDDELSISLALNWFLEISPNREKLDARISAARRHFVEATTSVAGRWSTIHPIDRYPDKPAMFLAQAQGLLRDRRSYDLDAGGKVMPFFATIGKQIDALRVVPGAAERGQRFLNPHTEHPDSGLFELVAALRYSREPGCFVEFIDENSYARMADFLVHRGNRQEAVHVECKRLRSSDYEQRELISARAMLNRINDFVHASEASVSIDATFTSEVADVPRSYLLDKLSIFSLSPFPLRGTTRWQDEHGRGEIKLANLASVARDIKKNDSLLFGPKMARLLADRKAAGELFHMVGGGNAREEDSRYVDQLRYGTVVFWRCEAPASVEARSRFVKSKLADIDRQLAAAPSAVAHIGMDAERDAVASDMRRQKNLDAVSNFQFKSPLLDVNLHYFLPRVTESSSWMIDETVDSFTGPIGSFLKDASLLQGSSKGIDQSLPAWCQQVPR